MATNVTRKGQVTIPKTVPDYLGLKPDTAVNFERLASGDIVLRPAQRSVKLKASAFARLRNRASVKMTAEDILALTRRDPELSDEP